MLWILLILAFVVVLGNLMLLWRTAKKPPIPPRFKPKPDEDGDGW